MWQGGHAWWGACMAGGMHDGGACMADTTRLTVNERAVRILLEYFKEVSPF